MSLAKSKQSIKKALLLLGLFFVLTGCGNTPPEVCVDSYCVQVELATTKKARENGLMNREHLPENTGMLFMFDQERYPTFWMKNTLIPLDLVWINEAHEVVHIHPNAQPGDLTFMTPPKKARYVLEVNGGETTHQVELGDTVRFKHF